MKQPQPGDQVIINGKIAVQGDALTEDEQFEKQLEQQVQQGEAQIALQGEAQGESPGQGRQESMAASSPLRNVRDILSKATPEQLADLEQKVIKAKSVGTGNGEWRAVTVHINQIAATNRIHLFSNDD